MKVVAVECDLLTPYGRGIACCMDALFAGRSAIAPLARFDTTAFHSGLAATVPDSCMPEGDSLVMRFLRAMVPPPGTIPADAQLLLATTTGEIDLLERAVLRGENSVPESRLDRLLGRARECFGVTGPGRVVSSACISSAAAVALGAAAIREGRATCVLVVACDAVSEFVFSGFSSLMALAPDGAKPFDANRNGLTVGEGAAWVLLMSEERARQEQRQRLGAIAGWGLSNDANHMTGPSRDGEGLARALRTALRLSGRSEEEVSFVCAHGTGTIYNDAMEMMALRSVFPSPRPVFSVKGGMGHTMGAAGLIECLLTFSALQRGQVPPTPGLRVPDELAAGWVALEAASVPGGCAISTNAGFGGVNAALVLQRAGEAV